MPSSAIIIQRPSIDFDQFLAITREMLGRSVSANCDASPKHMDEAEWFMECLSSMAGSESTPHVQEHVFFSVLFAADGDYLLSVLEIFSGMPFVVVPTQVRSITVGVVSGTLNKWRDALVSGNNKTRHLEVRDLFNKIMHCFQERGLDHIWSDYVKRQSPSGLFYLEDKRR